MLPDRVSNPGPLTYESGALPIALRGPAMCVLVPLHVFIFHCLWFHFFLVSRKALPKWGLILTLLHPERPKFNTLLAFLSAIGLKQRNYS